MREFVSLENLARIWKVDEKRIHDAADVADVADVAGVLLFTLHARPHADRNDLQRLGEAVHRSPVTQ